MREKKGTFKAYILSLLEKFPSGISEYNLLQELKGKSEQIPEDFSLQNLTLFKSHFLLFNALYELQLELPQKKGQTIEISPLQIQLRTLSSDECNKSLTDNSDANLRNYYLDLTNLEQTSAEDVEDMLSHFWKIYFSRDKRIDALKVLGLDEYTPFGNIRKRYREMAKKLHPDKGGDKKKLQQLNEAMEILEQYNKAIKK